MWLGLAMFIAVFVHMMWEKEGPLDRVFGGRKE
jgi:cytochrome c oxidase subunit IV